LTASIAPIARRLSLLLDWHLNVYHQPQESGFNHSKRVYWRFSELY